MPRHNAVLLALSATVLIGMAWMLVPQGAAAGSLTLEDRIDIQQLYSQYYQTIDAGQADAWADTFTADGSFNTNIRGRDALVAFIKRASANGPSRMRHWNSNLILTSTPEGAKGSVYVMQIDIRAKPITVATYSRYDDVLTKTQQGWRFRSRQRSSDTTIEPPRQ